jgi:hypothetical protein
MAAIRHLLMDLAGVACQFDRQVRLDNLAEASGASPESVERVIYDSGLAPTRSASPRCFSLTWRRYETTSAPLSC